MGHEPVTLDFIPGFSGWKGIYWTARRFAGYVLGKLPDIKSVISIFEPHRTNKFIDEFVRRYIVCTPTFWDNYSTKIIEKVAPEAVIVGSDQTWRPMYNPHFLNSMFLDFVKDDNITKLAYAASFGTSEFEFTEQQVKEITPLLNQFSSISVREKSGMDIVKRLGGDAVCVLDPTLLLGRDGFEKLLPSTKKKNVLGAYILDESDEISSLLVRVKAAEGCDNIHRFTKGEQNMGPLEWIDTIRTSKFVVTDSFHGTIFCLLFHIPFLTIVNTARGGDRFYSLLEPLGLENRLIESSLSYEKHPHSVIDWEKVDDIIEVARKKSFAFLKDSLKK